MSLVLIRRVCHVMKLKKVGKQTTSSITSFYRLGADFQGFEDVQSTTIQSIPMAFSSYELRPNRYGPEKSTDCPILIMHELLSSKDHWSAWSKALYNATHRKVIAFDARNHGDSLHAIEMTYPHLAEDIRSAMNNMDIERATLIGHRMGARAMMLMALRHPKLVKDMIIVDASPGNPDTNISEIPKYLEAMHQVRIQTNMTYEKALRSINKQLMRMVPSSVLRELMLSNVIQVGNVEYKWRVNLVSIAMNFPDIAMPPAIKGNNCFEKPTLFVDGGRSGTISKADRGDIRKMFKRAEFLRIVHPVKQLQAERSAEFLKRVIEFLGKTPNK